jgi:hypothetical protein
LGEVGEVEAGHDAGGVGKGALVEAVEGAVEAGAVHVAEVEVRFQGAAVEEVGVLGAEGEEAFHEAFEAGEHLFEEIRVAGGGVILPEGLGDDGGVVGVSAWWQAVGAGGDEAGFVLGEEEELDASAEEFGVAEAGEVDEVLDEEVAGVESTFAPGAVEVGVFHAGVEGFLSGEPDFVEGWVRAFEGADGLDGVVGAGEGELVEVEFGEVAGDEEFEVSEAAGVEGLVLLAAFAGDVAFGHIDEVTCVEVGGAIGFEAFAVGEVEDGSGGGGEVEGGSAEDFGAEVVEEDEGVFGDGFGEIGDVDM